MVLSTPKSSFEKILRNYPIMTLIELFSFLYANELAKFCRLNKASYHIMKSVANLKYLFEV
jgi:hypothetical protein